MTSVGVMASAVVVSSGVDVLLENFTSVAAWTGGSITSVAGGRTGNMGQLGGSGVANYTIPSGAENATVTIGFAYKVSTLAAARTFLQLLSDTGAVVHDTVLVNTDGSLAGRIGSAGATHGTTAGGLIAVNTWNYIEIQILLNDTTGVFRLRLNGTELITVTNTDTKSAGTKTVFDTVRLLGGGSGSTSNFDDLYVTMGAGAPFKGSITIP